MSIFLLTFLFPVVILFSTRKWRQLVPPHLCLPKVSLTNMRFILTIPTYFTHSTRDSLFTPISRQHKTSFNFTQTCLTYSRHSLNFIHSLIYDSLIPSVTSLTSTQIFLICPDDMRFTQTFLDGTHSLFTSHDVFQIELDQREISQTLFILHENYLTSLDIIHSLSTSKRNLSIPTRQPQNCLYKRFSIHPLSNSMRSVFMPQKPFMRDFDLYARPFSTVHESCLINLTCLTSHQNLHQTDIDQHDKLEIYPDSENLHSRYFHFCFHLRSTILLVRRHFLIPSRKQVSKGLLFIRKLFSRILVENEIYYSVQLWRTMHRLA